VNIQCAVVCSLEKWNFKVYIAWILTYKVWKFSSNQYSHGWNTEFFLGDCFLLAHPVDGSNTCAIDLFAQSTDFDCTNLIPNKRA